MKIKNFTELDGILKNSFKNLREESKNSDGALQKQIDAFSKKVENSNKSLNSLEKSTKGSLKDFEKSIKEFKKELSDFNKLQKKNLNESDKKVSSKLDSVNKIIATFKKDVINIVKIIKTKAVSQEVFDKRMKSTDENTKKIGNYIKEIIGLRDQISEQFGEVGSNKNNISVVNSKVNKLHGMFENLGQRLSGIDELGKEIKSLDKASVTSEKFNEEIKGMYEQIKETKSELNSNVKEMKSELKEIRKELISGLKHVDKIRDIEGTVKEITKRGASEVELRELKRTEESVLKGLRDEIKEIKKEVATKEVLNNEVTRLKGQLKDLKLTIGEWNKTINKELKLQSQSGKFMKEVASIFDEKKETQRESKNISEMEEIELDLKEMDDQPKQDGVLKKTMSGIIDFFIEDEDEIRDEEIRKIELEPVKEEIRPLKSVKKPKKITRKPKIEIIEEVEIKDTDELDSETQSEGKGLASKMKKGVVNFFFEEVDESLEENENVEVKPIDEKKAFESLKQDKSEDKVKVQVYGGKNGKEIKEKEKSLKKKKKNGKKPKVKVLKDKNTTSSKKKYKKLDKDTFVDDFGKETNYYPEDYFY